MRFDYSYKAFLISSLLVGNLILVMVTTKLRKVAPPEEETVPVEYLETLPEEELALSEAISEKQQITTNTAYNEAESYIREIENSRNSRNAEDTEENTETNTSSSYSLQNTGNVNFKEVKDVLENAKDKLALASKKKPKNNRTVNRKTTISYSLVDRKAMVLPNPVYTCPEGGTIVISIIVDELGKITKMDFNPTLSSTSNGCLIDAAMEYAQQSRFSTKAGKKKQMGTITYKFPGQ